MNTTVTNLATVTLLILAFFMGGCDELSGPGPECVLPSGHWSGTLYNASGDQFEVDWRLDRGVPAYTNTLRQERRCGRANSTHLFVTGTTVELDVLTEGPNVARVYYFGRDDVFTGYIEPSR